MGRERRVAFRPDWRWGAGLRHYIVRSLPTTAPTGFCATPVCNVRMLRQGRRCICWCRYVLEMYMTTEYCCDMMAAW